MLVTIRPGGGVMNRAIAGACLLLLLAGCSSGASQEELQQANDRASQAEASLLQVERDLEAKQADLDEALRGLAAAESDVQRFEATVRTLTSRSEQLQEDLDAVLLQYDPQIRAALGRLEMDLVKEACALGRTDAKDGTSRNDPLGDLDVDVPGGLQGRTIEDLVDAKTVNGEYTRCYKQERSILEEKRQQAQLTKNKGDGFYTVGEEIAAGTWRSTGGGGSCYWERLSGFSGDFGDIITNYFGSAGVTVTISSSDKAFKTEGCGTWEYIG